MSESPSSPLSADEERISGFLDKELRPGERDRIEASIASGDVRSKDIERLRRNDNMIRRVGASLVGEEIPERFIGLMEKPHWRPKSTGQPDGSRLAGNDNWPRRLRLGGALAASLAIGLLVGTQLRGSRDDALISEPLAASLEKIASGNQVRLASGQQFSPRLTFARQGGGYCREFSLANSIGANTGLACRTKSGWNVEALIPAAAAPSAEVGYVVAEGPSAAGLDEMVNAVRIGDPLDPDAEAKLIQREWRE